MSSEEVSPHHHHGMLDKQVSFSDRQFVIEDDPRSASADSEDNEEEPTKEMPSDEGAASSEEGDKPLYVTNPEQWLQEVTKAHEYVCIIIFRGHWCSYDHAYLTEFGELHKAQMKENGVHLIAWTSEGEEGAKMANERWGLAEKYDYNQVIGDETNALANWLKEDELLPQLVTSTPLEAQVTHKILPNTYPNGIVQPGVAFYAHHGILVMHWEAKVSKPTYGGAHRPQPEDMWSRVKHRKHALDDGNAAMPINGSSLKQTCEKLDGNCALM